MQILDRLLLDDYLNKKYDEAIFSNISPRKHVERKDGKFLLIKIIFLNPQEYNSKIKNYLFDTDMLIACHYWDSKFPKLFSPKQINEFKNLKIIGDV